MFERGEPELGSWVSRLAALPRSVSDARRVERLRELEEVACAVAAAQARDAAELDASRRAEHAAAGVPVARCGEGVAAELALARRVSPHRASRLLGLAQVLQAEMPHTLALMTCGRLTEWRATLLARETACLEADDRRRVDAELCGGDDPPAATLGDGRLAAAARRLAAGLDARSVAARAARATQERCVTLRPAPDTMTYLTALLPVADGVAVYAALRAAADTARTTGSIGSSGTGTSDDAPPRGSGQVMADTLVARITGRDPVERPVDLDLRVVLTDRTLLGSSGPEGGAADEPAEIPGYGPVPAPWVRRLVADALTDPAAAVWVRQLYAGPHGGLVATASRSRAAPKALADLIRLRDQVCRTPWCDAPVRHVDHVVPWAGGGSTAAENLQGLCERCNHARQAPGWHAHPVASGPGRRSRDGTRHTVRLVTPTGHRHQSVAPPLPGAAPDRPSESLVERRLRSALAAA